MAELGFLIGLAHGLTALTYVLGVLMQTLPIPRADWKAWGPVMMWDATVGQLALGLVQAVKVGVAYVSDLIQGSFNVALDPTVSYGLIMTQLTAIDAAIIILVSAISATVVLAPVAELLSRMLGSVVSWVTNAIILWTVIYTLITAVPKIWLILYQIGIIFLVIPFRLGRRFGAYLMASSIMVAIGIPILPPLAIQLEAYLGYELSLKQFQDAVNSVTTSPLTVVQLLTSLPTLVAGILQAIVIALIIFPISYLFALSLVTKSLSNLLGGSSGSAMFILTPRGG